MKVFVTKRADNNYTSIKAYISSEWGENIANVFEQKVKSFFELLEEFPLIGQVEIEDKQIRGFQLTPQTRLFYRIKGDKIIVLTLFDVRQDPEKKLI